MIFEKKKIQTETLGEYLFSVRNNAKLTIEEVSKKTGIKLIFLDSLEKGDFKVLPANVYVLGFLKQLSLLYSIDAEEIICQYKKEQSIQKQLAKQADFLKTPWYKRTFPKIVVTPKILTLILGLSFVVLTVVYIIWQIWSINKTPSLQVFSPQNNEIIKNAFLDVSGKTDPGTTVSVNEQNIFVDGSGLFKAQIGLSQGQKEIIVTSQNRFGRSISKTIEITGVVNQSENNTNNLVLAVDFSGPVTLKVAIDGQPNQLIAFNAGDNKTFNATQKILLSTSDAGATKVTLNGQALGAMGKAKEQLDDIPFYSQSGSSSPSTDSTINKH